MAVSEVEIFNLLVRLSGDLDDYKEMLKDAEGLADGFAKGFGKKIRNAGAMMTAGITAPIAGAAAASVKLAEDLNKGMANVQSLGLSEERTIDLKSDVQDIAISMGKSTDDIAEGLYNVVSAFGDTEESAKLLAINAKAGTAGLATTMDAINLTSAVTKGYGDTSAEAAQKAADLAFMTVKLGQTTFPELAASIGAVVPLASTLGASQEELFAQFATLTGVTGNTAAVSTQLGAVYNALMKPTKEMGGAISTVAAQLAESGKLVENKFTARWLDTKAALEAVQAEYQKAFDEKDQKKVKLLGERMKGLSILLDETSLSLGSSVIESTSAAEAIDLLTAAAEGDANVLGKMWGSSNAIKAVLALTGSQAEVFTEKLGQMGEATGASDQAFRDQSEGLSKLSFQAAQAKAQLQVIGQEMGDRLAPITLSIQEKLLGLVKWFGSLSEKTQEYIMIVAGVLAVIGPMLLIFGQMAIIMPKIIALMKLMAANALLVKIAMVGLALGGIAIVATYLYRTNSDIMAFNAALEKTKALTEQLNARKDRGRSDILGAASSLTGDDKQKFVEAQLKIAETELAGNKNNLKGSSNVLAEAQERGAGSKVIEAIQQEVKEAQNAVRDQQRFRDQLDDIINKQGRIDRLKEETLGKDPNAKADTANLKSIAEGIESIERQGGNSALVLLQDEVT